MKRFYIPRNLMLTKARSTLAGDTVPWNQQQSDSKRKQKGIWIHYEVGSQISFLGRGTSLLGIDLSNGNFIGSAAMTASQMRIAETIDAFYGDAGANDGVSRSYKQAVEDLDAETIKALDGPFRLEPPFYRPSSHLALDPPH